MPQKMRNPGYQRAAQVWEHDCAVLFNGIDFGPNLLYRKLRFLPGKIKRQQTNVAGMPGRLDDSDAAGYCVPDNLTGTLELWVTNARDWGMPGMTPEGYMSPEARFLKQISNQCRLDFHSSNGFYLNAFCELTKYERFDLGFKIAMKLDCEPYWWEDPQRAIEIDIGSVSQTNLFDHSTATLSTSHLGAQESCTWLDTNLGGLYVLRASPDNYAEVTVSGLNAAKRYSVGCQNTLDRGIWQLYDQNGRRVLSWPVTGVTSLTFRLISKSSFYDPVGFRDLCIYEVDAAACTGEITTLDAPLYELSCTLDAPARIIIGGEQYKFPVGEDVPVYGLSIPPRTTVPVQIVSDVACFGWIKYRRGARSCTL